MWVTDVPADVGIFLMMRITGPQYEFESEHTVTVTLIDPDAAEQEVLTATFGPAEMPPAYQPGMDPGMLIPAAIGWTAEHFGLHTLDISVDDRRNRSVPVLIRNTADLPQ